jgi:hypothetical protein
MRRPVVRIAVWACIILAFISILAVLTVARRPWGDTCSTKSEQTRVRIFRVLTWAHWYHEDLATWPDSTNWREALRTYMGDDPDREFLDADSTDAWGSALRCEQAEVDGYAGYRCISSGPNRQFEGGAGDDLTGTITKVDWQFSEGNSLAPPAGPSPETTKHSATSPAAPPTTGPSTDERSSARTSTMPWGN